MNIWDILQIKETKDKKEIKRAYARLVKVFTPEDDPVAYQNLREAYDLALKYANNNSEKQRVNNPVEDIIKKDRINKIIKEFKTEDKIIEKIEEEKKVVITLDNVISELEYIYKWFSKRIDINEWRRVLDYEVIWNANTHEVASHMVFKFVYNHPILPFEIYKLLETNFKWIEDRDKLKVYHGEKVVNEVLRNTTKELAFNFHVMEKIEYQQELYVDLIESIYIKARKENIINAKEEIIQAYRICNEDKELEKLFKMVSTKVTFSNKQYELSKDNKKDYRPLKDLIIRGLVLLAIFGFLFSMRAIVNHERAKNEELKRAAEEGLKAIEDMKENGITVFTLDDLLKRSMDSKIAFAMVNNIIPFDLYKIDDPSSGKVNFYTDKEFDELGLDKNNRKQLYCGIIGDGLMIFTNIESESLEPLQEKDKIISGKVYRVESDQGEKINNLVKKKYTEVYTVPLYTGVFISKKLMYLEVDAGTLTP